MIGQAAESNSWQDATSKALSLKNFLQLLAGIFGLILLFGIKCLYTMYSQKNMPYRSYTEAFANACKNLKLIHKQNNIQKLSLLWIELFALRLKLPMNAVTQERIQIALQNIGFEKNVIDEWNLFFTDVLAASYTKNDPLLYSHL